MATLVLTALGTAIGGPIGGALGAVLGRQADAAILRPAAREGPRLSDLRPQLSQYGTQIPKIFGTMRIAGTVIWASDLVENRTRQGGGKGRPATIDYSYSTSLAIALSARPILDVRRIWADGNILRGTAGDFTERTLFRVYRGSEDQPIDPLIGSALGLADASAFRGLAYAVFEGLELGNFGNRIPALTFEVEADHGDLSSLAVAKELISDSDIIIDSNSNSAPDSTPDSTSAATDSNGGLVMSGYAASGQRVRDALEPLVAVDKLRVVTTTDSTQLARSGQAGAVQPLRVAQHSADSDSATPSTDSSIDSSIAEHVTERRRVPLATLPSVIMLRHYEPQRDYQLGQQRVPVAQGGLREQHIDLPAVLAANQARAQAHRLATEVSDGRERLRVTSDFSALSLAVGGLVQGEGLEGIWRLTRRNISGDEVTLDLASHRPLALTLEETAAGTAVLAPDYEVGTGRVTVFDVPPLGEVARTTARRLIVGAGDGAGWRGADLWLSPSAEQESVALGTLRPARVLGQLEESLEGSGGLLFDETNSLLVRLLHADMELVSVEDSALASGANMAIVGNEVLQFGRATLVAPTLWRLSRLVRGQQRLCGSVGQSLPAHPIGSAFALLDDSAHVTIPAALDAIAVSPSATIDWVARGSFAIQKAALPTTRAAIRPLAPVHGSAIRHRDGRVTLRWIRRGRVGWQWRDSVDTPLGESTRLFRVAVPLASGGESLFETNTESLTLSAEVRSSMQTNAAIAVRQVGDFDTSEALLITNI